MKLCSSSSFSRAVILLLAGCAFPSLAAARGLLIYKQTQARLDTKALVFEYSQRVVEEGGIVRYLPQPGQAVPGGGNSFRPLPELPAIWIDYLDLSQEVYIAGRTAALEKKIAAYSDNLAQYPVSSPYLKPLNDQAKEVLRRVNAGEVWMKGQWLSKDAYASMVKSGNDKDQQQYEQGVTSRHLERDAQDQNEVEQQRHQSPR